MQSDFILAVELSERTAKSIKSIYNEHSAGRGPLAPILCKLGGRLGCWRSDYENWLETQQRLPPASKQMARVA